MTYYFRRYHTAVSYSCFTNLSSQSRLTFSCVTLSPWVMVSSQVTLTFWHRNFTSNSNKSPTWCNSFSVYYPEVRLQLNMLRAFSRPSSGARWLQWQPLVLPSYCGDSRIVFVVVPTTNTTRLSPRYEGKTRGCHCSHRAPDDCRENARNMLSCNWTSG